MQTNGLRDRTEIRYSKIILILPLHLSFSQESREPIQTSGVDSGESNSQNISSTVHRTLANGGNFKQHFFAEFCQLLQLVGDI